MKVKAKYESSLVLEKMEITESTFRKKDGDLGELELNVEVEHSMRILTEDVFEVFLVTIVSDEKEKVFIRVKGRAIFVTQQQNVDILKKNMIAIMFPYIRSYISIVTTQPGMEPVVLPAMNIAAMINEENK